MAIEPGRLRERRDAHVRMKPGRGKERKAQASLASMSRRPGATAWMQRARLALPGERRSSQPSTQRCSRGALALMPASSIRASSASSKGAGVVAATVLSDRLGPQRVGARRHLAREVEEGERAFRGRVEDDSRHAVARRFGEADVARDHGLEDLVAEVRLELLADLRLQRDAGVEHDAQDADHLERRVEVRVHLLDRVDQVREPFESEVLALHRHDDAVRARQAVQGQQAEAGRTVDEHEVVVGGGGGKRAAQALVAPLEPDQLHLGAGELAVRADDVVAALGARLARLRRPSRSRAGRRRR